ncbi:ribokinase [Dyella nitratireducens]|uniref:Ribokinase n=1 Tax=Dyella nitratireducens TaxID=1849580 RepID=A0ABQ1FU72_9GAMM|nr:ribokinase [Dyella nitratireducens]GGA30878.1 ribokinase [Dyella nitratireducens]GLQ42947.1 ribokinase [Dyella nitratireducens]
MTRIVVVGSINMDLVTVAPRFPAPGETLLGDRFLSVHGGKGGNQAVAAARLGADVHMVGAVGDDAFAQSLRDGLKQENVDVSHVTIIEHCSSGTASITVAGGENEIVVMPGANAQLLPSHVIKAQHLIASADAVLVQMEIPLQTVEATLRTAHAHHVPVILNPAPAQQLPVEWLKLARYITPNQHELATLLGADPTEDFHRLMRDAPCPVVLTRGAEGAWFREEGEPQHQSGFAVEAVDSTGAGDTFNAAFAVFLHEGLPVAVRKACAAAALSVTRLGARGGMPHPAEVNALLARQH